MALVDLFGISKQYDHKKLLDNVDYHLHAGDRTAIIGQNGCGKSTLMRIVHGELAFDDGRRIASSSTEIEMLAQLPKFADGLSVRGAIEHELAALQAAKSRYDELSELVANDFENSELLAEMEKVSNYLDHHQAWNLEYKIEQVLDAFKLKDFEARDINSLSGGEQRRVALAGLILKKPDVLILDEPTNHLDVYMVEFLEEMLLAGNFTILFVSHDRFFIDRIATNIIEVDNHKLHKYAGGYADFLKQKESRLLVMEKQQHNLMKHLASETEWLSRGVKARTKRNVGRVKRVHELREQAEGNPSMLRKMRRDLMREKTEFTSPDKTSSKKIYFDVYNLCYSIDERQLINRFKTKILHKDRISIVGPNGSGKSTLLKLLLGRLQPDSGNIKRAEFNIGYFDQQREALSDEKNLLETFCPNGGDRVEVQGKNMHVYGYLRNFLFPPEDLTKRIGMLSGGERSRVALALLFTQQVDCLILDEPTNDLDIHTINILEEKLASFEGVVIFVSHDRYFVDKVADKLFIFGENGQIDVSHQAYSDYLALEKALNEVDKIETELSDRVQKTEKTPETPKTETKKKLSYKDQRALDMLPDEIDQLERHIAHLNEQMQTNATDAAKLQELITEMTETQDKLTNTEEQYLTLLEQAEG